jgi:putative toxin-antitoxin system antitoxin component (TIGR02293 family)
MNQMAPDPMAEIAKLLGGKHVVGKLRSPIDLHRRVSLGLPFGALVAVGEHLDLSPARLAGAIGLPPATYSRRRRSARLAKPESEILARIARTMVLGKRALRSFAATRRWLERPNPGFQGTRPLELLTTEDGGREVEAGLGRLFYGGYS